MSKRIKADTTNRESAPPSSSSSSSTTSNSLSFGHALVRATLVVPNDGNHDVSMETTNSNYNLNAGGLDSSGGHSRTIVTVEASTTTDLMWLFSHSRKLQICVITVLLGFAILTGLMSSSLRKSKHATRIKDATNSFNNSTHDVTGNFPTLSPTTEDFRMDNDLTKPPANQPSLNVVDRKTSNPAAATIESTYPTVSFSTQPTKLLQVTANPTKHPSHPPTKHPTMKPTKPPTSTPSPTKYPTNPPTEKPSFRSASPTVSPIEEEMTSLASTPNEQPGRNVNDETVDDTNIEKGNIGIHGGNENIETTGNSNEIDFDRGIDEGNNNINDSDNNVEEKEEKRDEEEKDNDKEEKDDDGGGGDDDGGDDD